MFLMSVVMLLVGSVFTKGAQYDTNYYCYVSLRGDDTIAVYKMDTRNGSLEKIYNEPVSGGPASLALHPSKQYLYVARRSDNAISAYQIDPATGRLKFINAVPAVDNPVYISTDKSGRFLLSAYYNAGKAALYPIDTNGSLQPVAAATVSTDVNPHAIITDPDNRFLYITNMTGNSILQYQFNAASGMLTAIDPAVVLPPAGTGPRHLVFHGSGKYVYVVNETGNSITAYRADDISGALTEFQTISTLPAGYAGANKCADIHITPDNRFLYASNRGHESLAAFEIDADNDSLVSVGYYNTVKSPREFDIDPSGTYLYAAGETSGDLAWYRIDKISGVPDSLGCFTAGDTPSWVVTLDRVNTATSSDIVIPAQDPSGHNLKICPNPFGSMTSIRWFMDRAAHINISIYDVSGQLVSELVNGQVPVGNCSFDWETESGSVNNSIYYCKLETDNCCDVIKMVHVQ